MTLSLLKPEQVAELLGMSPSWVYSNKQNIGYVQFGKAVRFELDAVTEYARGCRRDPQLKEDRKWDTQFHTGKIEVRGSSEQASTASVLSKLFAQKEKRGSTH